MAYDRLAESVALIEGRPLEPVRRLTRRRRFAAMAVDVSGDVAVTMFARRGVGCTQKEIHVLACRDGEWRWLGAGGGPGDDDLLANRPLALPPVLGARNQAATGAKAVIAVWGSGGTRDGGDGTPSWSQGGGWISYADLRVNAQVTSVQVADRLLSVPWHGHVVVLWSGERPPRVVALDDSGNSLGEALLPTDL